MTPPTNWYNEMQEKIELGRKERDKQFKEDLRHIRETEEKNRQEDNDLFYKALQKSHDEAEKRKDAEIEQAKLEAMQEVERRSERIHGIKSGASKRLESDMKTMLKELNKK